MLSSNEYRHQAELQEQHLIKLRNRIKDWRFDTIAVNGLYDLQEATQHNYSSLIEPLYLSSAQVFRDSEEMAQALAYEIPSWSYSRIANPTVLYLENTLALLETYGSDEIAHCCTSSSGMSAIVSAIEPLLDHQAGDCHFVSSSQVYGGTFQQFFQRQPEKQVTVDWITDNADIQAWQQAIKKHTRFIYLEVPSNPNIAMADIVALAELAHHHQLPLIVDSTLATPALIRPINLGADIVIHSLSKTICSSGMSIGGAVIAKENLCCHYLPDECKQNYAQYLKLLPNRDNGPCLSPMNALLTLAELKTLRWRVDHFSQNAQLVAEFLQSCPAVEKVAYPGLKSYPQHNLAARLMQLVDSDTDPQYQQSVNRYGHLLSFQVKGGLAKARVVLDKLQLIWRATDLGRIKSVATIPAISTHQQQGESGRRLADIPDNLIRLSVGGEHYQDIITDLEQALNSI